jgi:hypothetical protein
MKAILERRAPRAAEEWFAMLSEPLARSESGVLRAYTSATRQLGHELLNLSDVERAELQPYTSGVILDRWRCDDLGRAMLLLDCDEKRIAACYEFGDSSEQESWLRVLGLLPQADRFLSTAIDACRTNILPVFEAIACENPFPAQYFPELNFNQMVLKALFNGIAIARIAGLESRFNEELSRMADDYVSEREAAGRDVPVDIWLAVAPKAPKERLARVQRYLVHENPQHRRWAAAGLGYRKD